MRVLFGICRLSVLVNRGQYGKADDVAGQNVFRNVEFLFIYGGVPEDLTFTKLAHITC